MNLFFDVILTSFEGFAVALLYCYFNSEVRKALWNMIFSSWSKNKQRLKGSSSFLIKTQIWNVSLEKNVYCFVNEEQYLTKTEHSRYASLSAGNNGVEIRIQSRKVSTEEDQQILDAQSFRQDRRLLMKPPARF